MGTTASALSSSTVSSSSVVSSTATFNGTSQYAGDLQQEINQAVAVASIPLTELQNNVSTLQSESSEVTTLQNDFTAIQTAVQNLSNGSTSLAATVSDNSVATVSVDSSEAVAGGTYTLDVISAGSPTSTISSAGLPVVADPSTSSISTSSTFTLTIDGSNYTITPSSNTLNALAEAINSAGLGVTATVVNVGPPASPDYRLALQSTSLGDENIQLNDGSQNLLTLLAAGTPAQYTVDGQPASPSTLSSTSASIALAPGVTANIVGAGETTITVAPDSSGAASALSAFATAYNQALSDLNNNHGTSGGALTGQSIVTELQQSLESLVGYTGGSGSVQSLADLGLTFNSSGQLTFNQATFEGVAATDPTDVANFLGSPTGGGFLEDATNLLNGLEDPNNGVFASTSNSLQQQITQDNQEITDTQTRITNMQNTLTAQMTQADTLIASLESQVSYYTTLFTDTNDAIQNGG